METPDPAHLVRRTTVETRLGTLEQELGVPTPTTIERVYANLDRARGVDAFLMTVQGASLVAIRRGLETVGIQNAETLGIFDRYVDAHSVMLTASGDTVDTVTWLDLSRGALVIDSPPNVGGTIDDFSFENVTSLACMVPCNCS